MGHILQDREGVTTVPADTPKSEINAASPALYGTGAVARMIGCVDADGRANTEQIDTWIKSGAPGPTARLGRVRVWTNSDIKALQAWLSQNGISYWPTLVDGL